MEHAQLIIIETQENTPSVCSFELAGDNILETEGVTALVCCCQAVSLVPLDTMLDHRTYHCWFSHIFC
jgi:hypothetical protein